MVTIRFRDLVKTAGKPEAKSLWSAPQEDRGFMQAVKQKRVLTVRQEPASKKKDFGELGFHPHAHAAYFVFPKPLPPVKGRVIGIKYDLVESAEPNDVIPNAELKHAAKSKRPKSLQNTKRGPIERTFNVLIQRMAVSETNISVKARTKSEARKKAADLIEGQGFDLSKAKIKNQVKSAK